MKIKNAVFHSSASALDDAPVLALPEVAVIGRSNVGKSSLINMLANRKSLARISATPGKTRLLNFFVMDEAWCLVDLPGYGYAKVSRKTQSQFDEAVTDYLRERPQLVHCFVLIDARIPPQTIDLDFLGWVGAGTLDYSLLFTKAEKLSEAKTQKTVSTFHEALALAGIRPPAASIPCSSITGKGRGPILETISRAIREV